MSVIAKKNKNTIHSELAPNLFRNKAFRSLLSSFVFGNIADGMSMVLIPLLLVQVTLNPIIIGSMIILRTFPLLILSLPAGVFIDRFSRKKISAIANLLRSMTMIIVFLIFTIYPFYLVEALLVASFLLGIGEVFYDLAAVSLVPQIVQKRELVRASAVMTTLEAVASILFGTLIGTYLFTEYKALTIGIAALFYFLSFVLLINMAIAPLIPKKYGSIWTEMAYGFKIIMRSRVLMAFSIVGGINNTIFYCILATLVLYVNETMGANEMIFAVINSAPGIGLLLGGIFVIRVLKLTGLKGGYNLNLIIFSVSLGMITLSSRSVVVIGAFLLMGFGWVIAGTVSRVFRQASVPIADQGKVHSFSRLISAGTMPIGSAIGTWLTASIGFEHMYKVLAVGSVLVGCIYIVYMRHEEIKIEGWK